MYFLPTNTYNSLAYMSGATYAISFEGKLKPHK
jgi:hypothetical protein